MGTRILVVDDDHVMGSLLRAVLAAGGHTVEVATDGADAVRRAAEQAPAVMLVDALMPGLDGYEVCRRVRAQIPTAAQPHVVLLTAAADTADPDRVAAAGIDEVMAKPFEPGALLARVGAISRSRQ